MSAAGAPHPRREARVVRQVDRAFADDGVLGEGPVWNPAERRLWWVDVHGRRLLKGTPGSGTVEELVLEQPVASFALTTGGAVLTAARGQFATLEDDGSLRTLTRIARECRHPANRLNDGKCDPRGRFWAGSISTPPGARCGALYRLDPDGSVHTALEGVGISNGMGWSPDGRTFYYVDSANEAVDAFDFDADSGWIGNRRQLVACSPADGLPDGLAVDVAGCVWVAMFFAGRVHRYTPVGDLDTVVEVPVRGTASVAFGGNDLRDLYITTGRTPSGAMAARYGRDRGDAHIPGTVFVHRVAVAGVPVAAFGAGG